MLWPGMWSDEWGVGLGLVWFAMTVTRGGIALWLPWKAIGLGPDGFWTRPIPDVPGDWPDR